MQNTEMLNEAINLIAQTDEDFPNIIQAEGTYAIVLEDDTGFIMIFPESDNDSFKVSICFNSAWIHYDDEEDLDVFLGIFDWVDEDLNYIINPRNTLSATYTVDMKKVSDSIKDYSNLLHRQIKKMISTSYAIDQFFIAFLELICDFESLF